MKTQPATVSIPDWPVHHAGLRLVLAAQAVLAWSHRVLARRRGPYLARVVLARGGLVSLGSPDPVEVICRRGQLWITQTRDATDYILQPRQRWRGVRGERVVLQATEDAELLLRFTRSARTHKRVQLRGLRSIGR